MMNYYFRRNLGGKLGHQLSEKYQLECIGQLTNIPKTSLIKDFGTKTGFVKTFLVQFWHFDF